MSEQLDKSPIQDISALHPIVMLVLGLGIGVIAGFGAVLFRMMIGFAHNLLFFGRVNLFYEANLHTLKSPWGIGIILVPVLGVIVVTWITKTFAPEAKGHGVPEVIDAIYFKEGKIRPSVVIFKSIASAITIGSGGSVGREGPIIQIGSAFGSTVGQWIKMPIRQRIILIAAGAGAGIAATFNAPIGGIAFAVELLLVSINAATLAVVAISTISAAYIGRQFIGIYPAFNIPLLAVSDSTSTPLIDLVLMLPFGIVIGCASALFVRILYWVEDQFHRIPLNEYLRNMFGMLMLGIIFYTFMETTGHYHLEGIGYSTIVDVLSGVIKHPWFLLLLYFAKLISTSITLGSGGSGGVFSPALFMGATLGAAFGEFAHLYFPHLAISPVMFAVAGMAGMVGGATGAVLTAIIMLFEMTRDYNVILPVILTVTVAYMTRVMISRESIYTLKLLRRGRSIHEGLQAAISSGQIAQDVMTQNYKVVAKSQIEQAPSMVETALSNNVAVVVEENGTIIGLLKAGADLRKLDAMIIKDFVTVTPHTGLIRILRKMRLYQVKTVFVTRKPRSSLAEDLIGVITPNEVTEMASQTALLMNEAI